MKKLVILLLLLLNISICSFAQREQDSLALVALYNSTGGANWTNNTNWLSSEPISKWYGVGMDNSRVVALVMYSNNLVGILPPEIGNLTNLSSLLLYNNKLTGTIPPDIGDLTMLSDLQLNVNHLSSPIPPQLWNLNNLNRMNLHNNNFSGSIPPEIGNLKNITYLDLSYNSFSGIIPIEIGNLKNLCHLELWQNQLTSAIPTELCSLYKLSYLDVSGNQLSGAIPKEIGNLNNMTFLNLNVNQLSGAIPKEIGNLVNLTWLYASVNQLSGSIPSQINNLKNLQYITIDYNRFIELPSLTINTLIYVTIDGNCLTFESIEPLFNNLPTQYFMYTPQDSIGKKQNLAGRINKSITLSVTCGGAHNIYQWKKNNVDIPSANSSTIKIPKLKLSDAGSYTCTVTNTVVTDLTINSRPINLSIMLKGRDKDSLALVTIYNTTGGLNWTNNTNWLSSQPISEWYGVTVGTNGGTKGLSDSTSVLRLDLSGNNLSGTIPPEIGTMTGLQSLNLGSNNLTGAVPTEINSIPSLQTLDLSNNNLEDLPVLTFMSLDTLELGKNQFSFEDIEPNINVSGKEFDYLIQDSIGIRKDTICNEGTNISFAVDDSALYNNYQWYKDGNLIPSASSSTYSLTNLTQNEAGSYHCAITNSLVPNLTIYSRPIKLIVSALTGIERNTIYSIKIYPNPTNGFFKIESIEGFSDKATLEVYDCYGKVICLRQLENTQYNEIDLSQLSKGIYLLRIKNSNRYYYQKFILQ